MPIKMRWTDLAKKFIALRIPFNLRARPLRRHPASRGARKILPLDRSAELLERIAMRHDGERTSGEFALHILEETLRSPSDIGKTLQAVSAARFYPQARIRILGKEIFRRKPVYMPKSVSRRRISYKTGASSAAAMIAAVSLVRVSGELMITSTFSPERLLATSSIWPFP